MHWVDAVLVGVAVAGWIVALLLAIRASLHVCHVSAPPAVPEPTTTTRVVLLNTDGQIESERTLRTPRSVLPSVIHRPRGKGAATAYRFMRHDNGKAVYQAET